MNFYFFFNFFGRVKYFYFFFNFFRILRTFNIFVIIRILSILILPIFILPILILPILILPFLAINLLLPLLHNLTTFTTLLLSIPIRVSLPTRQRLQPGLNRFQSTQ